MQEWVHRASQSGTSMQNPATAPQSSGPTVQCSAVHTGDPTATTGPLHIPPTQAMGTDMYMPRTSRLCLTLQVRQKGADTHPNDRSASSSPRSHR